MTQLLVITILLALFHSNLLSAQTRLVQLSQNERTRTTDQDIDSYVRSVIDAYEIPGVSLAVIKNGNIIHQNDYGYANLEHRVPISNKSIFRVYSLTKLFIAVGVFQLIEKEELSLEDPISKYVHSLPSDWQALQIQHLLSHSSGLPDMSPIPEFQDLTKEEAKAKVFSQHTKFQPGEAYDYNQTGFWLLQETLEHVAGMPLQEFILSNQFDSNQDTVFFSSDSRDIIPNRATAYFPFAKGYQTIDHPYLKGDYAYAINGLNITLDEFISWDEKLQNNQLISERTRQRMWSTYPYSKSNKIFAYGWDMHMSNGTASYGFSGSLVTAYRTFPDKNMSIIFLGNGMGQWFDIEDIMDQIASLALKN